MRIDEARALAADWVRAQPGWPAPFVGAFFTGSTVDADPAAPLAATSDVDLAVVLDGEAPGKPGKLDHHGVLLEVTYLPWADLADPAVVARTFYLAPSFARDTVVADPSGRLAALRGAVAPVFARPDVVRDRWGSVLARMTAAPAPADSWAVAVTRWLFPMSLGTAVVLVAARANPTVRLRYLRAREALTACGLADRYRPLLDELGCADVAPALVVAHLDAMAAAFDDAAAGPPAPFFFAADLTPAARPVPVDGARDLVAAGDHREAVFWLVATFARCVQALDAADAPAAARHRDAFAAAVDDLLGLRGADDLARRRAAVLAGLPALVATAEEVLAATPGRAAPDAALGRRREAL
ncbi:hypothetical protein SAMN04488543_4120 [Friedmanniella luteola]|uniref:Uncharacterized protein n=1 Tax=Friedmanniella luteola TaxID=546871 RepID=A0A1H1ZZL8_9ACTN|nr:hypothetical protein [Friedmanniella luteola]SDT39215.1 hypothetical protein SAMN04488543_4120 [Friedmanniella luteola]